MFTFYPDGYNIFEQAKWAPYLLALGEGKPPPGSFRRKKSRPSLSRGASYLARMTLAITAARKTLTIMSKSFDERFGQASRAIEDQQPLWTGPLGGWSTPNHWHDNGTCDHLALALGGHDDTGV